MSSTPVIPADTLLPSEAARVIGRSTQGLRYLENAGRIHSIRVGLRGMRIYARPDAERLAEELRAAKK